MILSPTPPVECLSAVGRDSAAEVHPLARRDHRVGPAGDLATLHAVEQDGHRQRRHLLVGDHPARVGVDHPVDLRVGELSSVALADDHLDRTERLCHLRPPCPTGTLWNPRSTKVPRLSGSPASARSGYVANRAPSDSTSSIRASGAPRQKCTPTPNATWLLGVAVDPELVGRLEDRRVAVGRAQQHGDPLAGLDDDVAQRRRPRSRCARRAAAPSRSGASPRRRPRTSGPGRSPRWSIAVSPLPNTLTDASCPALSSSTAEATISSSESSVVVQVAEQVSPAARSDAPGPARG